MPFTEQTWGQKLQKVLNSHYFDPCISWNIGHGDPIFGVQMKAFFIINNHQVRRKCAFNWQNVPPNTSKSAKITLFSPYISLNIGHSDLLSGMQIDVPNTIHNHHTRRIWAYKWQNVPPLFTDGRWTTDDGRQTTDDRRRTLLDCIGSPKWAKNIQKHNVSRTLVCGQNYISKQTDLLMFSSLTVWFGHHAAVWCLRSRI